MEMQPNMKVEKIERDAEKDNVIKIGIHKTRMKQPD